MVLAGGRYQSLLRTRLGIRRVSRALQIVHGSGTLARRIGIGGG